MATAIAEPLNSVERYEYHPLANIYPLATAEEHQRLVADIKANGLNHEITLYEGKILDGRNRYRACLDANVEPTFQNWNELGGDEHFACQHGYSPLLWVVSQNSHRRHLSVQQLAMVAAQVAGILEGEAHERQIANLKSTPVSANLRKQEDGKSNSGSSTKKAAELVGGVSFRTVDDAKLIQEHAPEVAAKILAGDKTAPAISTTAKALRKSHPKPEAKPTKKYPALPPPPILPPSNPATLKAFADALEILKSAKQKLSTSIETFHGILKNIKPQNGEEFQKARLLEEICETMVLKLAVPLHTETEALTNGYDYADLYAASEALTICAMTVKPETWTYGSEFWRSKHGYRETCARVTNALKLTLAPLGYRKTMGNTFKRVDEETDSQNTAPKSKPFSLNDRILEAIKEGVGKATTLPFITRRMPGRISNNEISAALEKLQQRGALDAEVRCGIGTCYAIREDTTNNAASHE